MDSQTEAAVIKLHEAYELLRQASETLGHPAAGFVGAVMDLIANTADLVESLATGDE